MTLKAEADSLFKNGRWAEAEKAYTRALGEDTQGERHKLLHNRALARFRLGLRKECITDCKAATDAEAKYAKAWFLWAKAALACTDDETEFLMDTALTSGAYNTPHKIKWCHVCDGLDRAMKYSAPDSPLFVELSSIMLRIPLVEDTGDTWYVVLLNLAVMDEGSKAYFARDGMKVLARAFAASSSDLFGPVTWARSMAAALLRHACITYPQLVDLKAIDLTSLPWMVGLDHPSLTPIACSLVTVLGEHKNFDIYVSGKACLVPQILSCLESRDDRVFFDVAFTVMELLTKDRLTDDHLALARAVVFKKPQQATPLRCLLSIGLALKLLAVSLPSDAEWLGIARLLASTLQFSSEVTTFEVPCQPWRPESKVMNFQLSSIVPLAARLTLSKRGCDLETACDPHQLAHVLLKCEDSRELVHAVISQLLDQTSKFHRAFLQADAFRCLLAELESMTNEEGELPRAIMLLLLHDSYTDDDHDFAICSFFVAKGLKRLRRLIEQRRMRRSCRLVLIELLNSANLAPMMAPGVCKELAKEGFVSYENLRKSLADEKTALLGSTLIWFLAGKCFGQVEDVPILPTQCATLLREVLQEKSGYQIHLIGTHIKSAVRLVMSCGVPDFAQWLRDFCFRIAAEESTSSLESKKWARDALSLLAADGILTTGSPSAFCANLRDVDSMLPKSNGFRESRLGVKSVSDAQWDAYCTSEGLESGAIVVAQRELERADELLSGATKLKAFKELRSNGVDVDHGLSRTLTNLAWDIFSLDLKAYKGVAHALVVQHYSREVWASVGADHAKMKEAMRQVYAGDAPDSLRSTDRSSCFPQLREQLIPHWEAQLDAETLKGLIHDNPGMTPELAKAAWFEQLSDAFLHIFYMLAMACGEVCSPEISERQFGTNDPASNYPEDVITHIDGSCACCGATGTSLRLKSCSVCRQVRYCSKQCQAADWKHHRRSCTRSS